jgi:hypothetical protein
MKKTEFNSKEINEILRLPRRLRLKELFHYIGSTQEDVVRASGKSKTMVSFVFTGSDKSSFVASAAYNILQQQLGDLCPGFDALFGDETEQISDRTEKQIVHG